MLSPKEIVDKMLNNDPFSKWMGIKILLVDAGKCELEMLVTKDMLKTMRPGTVLVDVAVDQGGCIETCTPTTHENPTFIIEYITHVSNSLLRFW